MSLLYIGSKSDLWKEPISLTPRFQHTTWQTTLLLISNVLNRVITYADKLLIYPILGGTMVAVYYAATVFGKVVSLVITPVNSVALTYLSKASKEKENMLRSALLLGLLICGVGYVVCIAISRPVLEILYPQFVDQSMEYIYITTATTVVYALISIVNPFILKFFDMKWQIVINSGTAIVYVTFCLGFLNLWGLWGFCLGALVTNVLKLFIMLGIYMKAGK